VRACRISLYVNNPSFFSVDYGGATHRAVRTYAGRNRRTLCVYLSDF
jgi:hypothetical protein